MSADPTWRVVVDVEAESPSGKRSVRLDLPRGDFDLSELHDLARGTAEVGNVLFESGRPIAHVARDLGVRLKRCAGMGASSRPTRVAGPICAEVAGGMDGEVIDAVDMAPVRTAPRGLRAWDT
jgi:hypothetical protein